MALITSVYSALASLMRSCSINICSCADLTATLEASTRLCAALVMASALALALASISAALDLALDIASAASLTDVFCRSSLSAAALMIACSCTLIPSISLSSLDCCLSMSSLILASRAWALLSQAISPSTRSMSAARSVNHLCFLDQFLICLLISLTITSSCCFVGGK